MILSAVFLPLILATAVVLADHGGHHHHDYHAPPHYSYEYGVEAYGKGYHGGDPGPLPYKHSEHREGYTTKVSYGNVIYVLYTLLLQGQFHVQLPGKSFHNRDYLVTGHHR